MATPSLCTRAAAILANRGRWILERSALVSTTSPSVLHTQHYFDVLSTSHDRSHRGAIRHPHSPHSPSDSPRVEGQTGCTA